ncbi:hypothetical protein N0V93_005485 [Gnomoniopsis smithogilvyi]|uniref:Fe2OG dioxygenase domain-containing protein n=1 Tax=Gnomoniopsis smithogilvyi TaxID=1191159 RepID=A0A9W9CY31_9PEZI|nr:hypothetical protein N0V93_005485 [Gnomoniopsis smithogilvyi]
MTKTQIPVIDASPLFQDASLSSPEAKETVAQIHSAFTTWGIFLLTGTHCIPPNLTVSLRQALDAFFSLPLEQKTKIHLKKGGWAWRGYMPWGGEGSGGLIDQKEGFYGGQELSPGVDDALQTAGLPTYGKNQFPDDEVPELRGLVLEYIDKVTELGLVISDALSMGLGLGKDEVRERFLSPEPIQLFRAFKYSGREGHQTCGIGEHTDFGFLTILAQNATGLQVVSPQGDWTDVPVVPDSFVVNVGDILDRLTSGLYVAPVHRVLPPSLTSPRLSIPFFFDPAWTAKIEALPLAHNPDAAALKRWERRSTFNSLQGVWGQYLGVKVQKVFPDLVLPEFPAVSRASTRHLVEVHKA